MIDDKQIYDAEGAALAQLRKDPGAQVPLALIDKLADMGLVTPTDRGWRLTDEGERACQARVADG